MNVEDPDLADALFLANHPGWSWADLAGTPERVLLILKRLEKVKRA